MNIFLLLMCVGILVLDIWAIYVLKETPRELENELKNREKNHL